MLEALPYLLAYVPVFALIVFGAVDMYRHRELLK
jgi:hypothetical protein